MKIYVQFQDEPSFNVHFVQTECTFKPDFGEIITIRAEEVYDGDYNVIPRVYPQTLYTQDKLMEQNVTVEVIPLSKVINLQNGYTVTIG